MNRIERELLIEKIGIRAADELEELRQELQAIYKYLGVGKAYSTKGFTLVKLHE